MNKVSFQCASVNEKGKEEIPIQGHHLWSLPVLPMSAQFSPDTLVSSYIPQMFTLGGLACLNLPSLNEYVCGRALDGRVSCPGFIPALLDP